ncbi:hypothetical protein C8Q74DRAFT_1299887 [Fomes fomentarius]|nr:hypothetical protein C8Q74DRAFT_1299887 [Fomes fomentarius]
MMRQTFTVGDDDRRNNRSATAIPNYSPTSLSLNARPTPPAVIRYRPPFDPFLPHLAHTYSRLSTLPYL